MQNFRSASWAPRPVFRLSVWLHVGVLVALVLWPAAWRWAVGTVLANHLFLGIFCMWPRSTLLGANLVRLPSAGRAQGFVALTFDDGPDPYITPRVLDLLDRYQATASFFCIGERAARHPDIVRDIVRRGHSVENHSNRHSLAFAFYAPPAIYRDIDGAQGTLTAIAGHEPRFFRAPFGLRSPLLDPVLARTPLCYVSWTRRGYDAVSRNPSRVLRRVERGLTAGDILLLHDGGAGMLRGEKPVVLEVLPRLLDHMAQRGLRPVSLPIAMMDQPGLRDRRGDGTHCPRRDSPDQAADPARSGASSRHYGRR